jgi:hypothetical protein
MIDELEMIWKKTVREKLGENHEKPGQVSLCTNNFQNANIKLYLEIYSVRAVMCGVKDPYILNLSLKIWRVAANILNKQYRTADKGWSSSLVVGRGVTTPHLKK